MQDDSPNTTQEPITEPLGAAPWRGVVRQVVVLMRALAEQGEVGSIDLLEQALDDEGYQALREHLGEGDLDTVVGEDGNVELVQTAHAGVWWVTYHDEQGGVIGDFIEVAYCPEVLIPTPDDVRESMEALQARLFASDNQGLLPFEDSN